MSFRQCARGLWACRKSQKISTASDQYFLSYVKKTRGEGGQIDPPPAGIGLNFSVEKGLENNPTPIVKFVKIKTGIEIYFIKLYSAQFLNNMFLGLIKLNSSSHPFPE